MDLENKIGKSLFTRFLISYIVVMLIPATVLYLLYTKETADTVAQEIYTSVVLDQQYAVSLIDNKTADLRNIAAQFQLTRGFRSYLESHAFYSSQSGETYGEIIEDLFSLSKMNAFAENFFVYFYDKKCAFSAQGLHQIDTFIHADYRYESYNPQQYLALLNSVSSPTILGSQKIYMSGGSANYITFIYPLYERFGQVTATAVFCVNENRFAQLFSSRMTEYNTSTYIFDSSDELIYANNPVPSLTGSDFSACEQDYRIITLNSEENDWRVVTLLPKKQSVIYRLLKSGQSFILYSSLTLLFSFLIVWYMMRVNYSPIRKLKEKASVMAADGTVRTELDTISHALDYLNQQNTLLHSTVINTQTLITNNQLRKLLNGTYATPEDFNSDNLSNLHYSGTQFFVAIIMFHHVEDFTEEIAETISGILGDYLDSNYIYHLEPDKLITINCIPNDKSPIVTDVFCTMLKVVNQRHHITATVGVGTAIEGTVGLGRSYMEAQSALDYRFVKGKGTVILYNDICADADALPGYPHLQFERLKNAIAARDDLAIGQQIEELLCYITQNSLPLFLARGICFDLLRIVSDNNGTLNLHSNPMEVEMLQELAGADTAQDVVGMIQRLQQDISHQRSQKAASPQKVLDRMVQYLNEHCYDYDFSIQTVADRFDMLPSNLSAFFKLHTGGNILDCVIDLRMKKAKELLRTTNRTLSDIGQEVGYYNVSSFVRRFRQHQGVTPGTYRKSADII